MRRKKFLTLAAALLCGVVSAIAFTSCDDDDDPKTTSLRLNPAKVEVTVGATANVSVSGGAEPYTVKSADEAVATVKANKSSITVTGVKAGTTTVLVSDKNKQTGSLSPF